VDERRGLQRLDQVAAADDLEVLFGLLLERGDGRNDVTVEERRVVPLQRLQRARGHVLLRRIERAGYRIVLRLIRPVRFEDLVGLAAEHELAIPGVEAGRGNIDRLVEVWKRPAAESKAACGIFLRSAGR